MYFTTGSIRLGVRCGGLPAGQLLVQLGLHLAELCQLVLVLLHALLDGLQLRRVLHTALGVNSRPDMVLHL